MNNLRVLRADLIIEGVEPGRACALTGSASSDALWGGDGKDLLMGGGGDDDLDAGAANDCIFAGVGGDMPGGATKWVMD